MSFFVGLIHVNASVDHRREYALYTTVFALIAAVQMGWAVLLVRRPSRQVLIVGALVSLAIAVLWVASRTSGVPLGPRPWVPEAVGVADVAATVGECAIALSVWCVLSAPRVEFARRASSWLAWPLLALLVFGVLFGLSPHAG